MKAVAYRHCLPIADSEALLDVELPEPAPGAHDLLVEVRAISVNPVDTKIRRNQAPPAGQLKVLGWDVAGVVRAVGSAVSLFRPGDRVYYAGAIDRPGANSELHLVDERIVGRMPDSLDFAQAAALPLTSITAWELLFERLAVPLEEPAPAGTLLVVGAAGGVGSILVQLARKLSSLQVVATCGRAQSREWLHSLGAHQVIDHHRPLHAELRALGIEQVERVASLTHTDDHFEQLIESLAPQGRLGLIDDPAALDVLKLKRKSLSLHWEFMFTRSLFGTPDMIAQHHLLNRVAELVDRGVLKTTLNTHLGTINAGNLRRAHSLLESAESRGKIVLEGF
jgi:zinc-binding alcohol dehydrogenase family protein